MDKQNNLIAEYAPHSGAKPKNNRISSKFAVLLLVCCLISGAAGSCFTALLQSGTASASNGALLAQGAGVTRAINAAVNTGESLTIADIAAVVSPAVVSVNVTITTVDRFGRRLASSSSGSGFIVTEDGYILTGNHVIEGATDIKVTLSTGKEYAAALVGADAQTDLAVLKIDEVSLPCVTMGDSDRLKTGDVAVAIGNPLGELSNTVTAGIISATDRELTIEGETMNLLQTDAAINPGNSGGALCDRYGEVIGVVNAKTSALGVEGLGFAIPINDAKDVAAELIAKGYVSGRASLGLSVQEITGQTARFFRTEAGVYAASVASGGAADKAGVKAGDRIVSLGGQTVTSAAELKAIKEKHAPGDAIEIVVSRDGRSMTLTIVLQESR
jgi:serine protease Do